MERRSEADAVAEIARLGADIQQFDISGIPMLAAPDGVSITGYETLLPRPNRLHAHPKFRDAESFGAYIEAYKQKSTIVIGNRDQAKFEAVIDYHESQAEPRWGSHKADLVLRFSDEWKAWTAIPPSIGQVQFAEHIEDWMHTIGHPDGATLQGLVLKFQTLKDTTFKSVMNLANGDVNLAYIEEEREQGAKFPTAMTLKMPVYEGQLPIQVEARIRYRVVQNKLTFQIAILQKSEILQKAFQDVCEAVENITGIKPLMGA